MLPDPKWELYPHGVLTISYRRVSFEVGAFVQLPRHSSYETKNWLVNALFKSRSDEMLYEGERERYL